VFHNSTREGGGGEEKGKVGKKLRAKQCVKLSPLGVTGDPERVKRPPLFWGGLDFVFFRTDSQKGEEGRLIVVRQKDRSPLLTGAKKLLFRLDHLQKKKSYPISLYSPRQERG